MISKAMPEEKRKCPEYPSSKHPSDGKEVCASAVLYAGTPCSFYFMRIPVVG
jgi:hypothetical protein